MTDLNINDLLKTNKTGGHAKPQVATDEKAKILDDKIEEIDQKNIERATELQASQAGFKYINLSGFPVSTEAISLIKQETALELKTVCFFSDGSEIRLGSLNPDSPQVEKLTKEIAKKHIAHVDVYLISQHSFDLAYRLYAKIPKIKETTQGVKISQADLDKYKGKLTSFAEVQKAIKEVNISELVTVVMAAALENRSSDVHIEAEEKDIVVRFRIDGVLHTVAKIESEKWNKIISRLKLISGLKLNITSKPQDGRFTIHLKDDEVDVRVSTIPTAYGESVVMRLLKSSAAGLEFDQLGLRGKAEVDLKTEAERPNGMIITTGPTGSGKTTTLYAVINKLNTPETKIITLEDPIEYKLAGINQSQIDHSKNYNFADGLRSILRQDPDVVMVGEIRDLETADVAINAALTGHLVISTIHTNSAAGAIPRFLAMGVKPFLLAPAINAVIGQRLVRKICDKCKVTAEPTNDVISKVYKILSEIPNNSGQKLTKEELNSLKFYKGGGCEECNGLGYKGRTGIYEIMTMTPEIEQVILSGKVSEFQMQEIAVKNGMVTMVQDGLLKAKDGITSLEEVFRVAE